MRPSRGPRKTHKAPSEVAGPSLVLSLGMLALAEQELLSQLCLLLVGIQ